MGDNRDSIASLTNTMENDLKRREEKEEEKKNARARNETKLPTDTCVCTTCRPLFFSSSVRLVSCKTDIDVFRFCSLSQFHFFVRSEAKKRTISIERRLPFRVVEKYLESVIVRACRKGNLEDERDVQFKAEREALIGNKTLVQTVKRWIYAINNNIQEYK